MAAILDKEIARRARQQRHTSISCIVLSEGDIQQNHEVRYKLTRPAVYAILLAFGVYYIAHVCLWLCAHDAVR